MSYSLDDWRVAITALLKQTSAAEISWSPSHLFEGDSWNFVDASFQVEFSGRIFVISATRSKHYLDEDQWAWSGGHDLSVFRLEGANYLKLISAPDMSILSTLFDAAKNSFGYSQNALGGLLG